LTSAASRSTIQLNNHYKIQCEYVNSNEVTKSRGAVTAGGILVMVYVYPPKSGQVNFSAFTQVSVYQ